MKKSIITSVLALTIVSASFASHTGRVKIVSGFEKMAESDKSVKMGMYAIKDSEKLRLNVVGSKNVELNIKDEKGRVLNFERLGSKTSVVINLENMPSGTYYVELNDGKDQLVKKIVKGNTVVKREITIEK